MPKKTHQDEIVVVGIEARTTNAKEMAGAGVIPAHWQKFFHDGIAGKIPNKIDSTIYAVYSDYASNLNGEYSFFIGVRVPDKSAVPAGMVLKTISAGEYAVIVSEEGPASKVVPAAWQQIWALEDEGQLGGKRAYKTDFEIYDGRAADPEHTRVEIRVGLK